MSEQIIENHIDDVFTGDTRKNALEFISFLRKNEMKFERGMGYWEDKFYWLIKYRSEYVCFILINSDEDETEPVGWVIWMDGGTSCFTNNIPDKHTKEVAWKHIDICGNCGGCENPGGSHQTIFGKGFDNVCITPLRFDNPDADTVECVKKLVALRGNDIRRNANL